MILFGREHAGTLDATALFAEAKAKREALAAQPLVDIINTLDSFGRAWREDPRYTEEALAGLRADLPFSEEMVRATLAVIPEILSREALTKRVEAELGGPQILDRFVPARHGLGLVRAFPLGEVLHVTAGNVFISCIDSLVMGLLTKNVSYLKLSSRNNFFPFFFARALIAHDRAKVVADKFCLLTWKGGDASVEDAFKRHVPAILAWGGEEMLESYRRGLAPGTKLLDYGPKISFQVLTKGGLEKAGLDAASAAIARDLVMWDQQACSSPQNLFVEKGADIPKLLEAIGRHLDAPAFPRGELSADEHVELLKERERARVSRHLEGGHSREGATWLLHHETRPFLRASPLNRTLVLKDFTDEADLLRQVAPFRFYLQSCGYLTGAEEKERWLSVLGRAGLKRFAPLGKMSETFAGLPHDGRYGLTELVSLVTDEAAVDEDGYFARLRRNLPFFKDRDPSTILTDGALFAAHDPAVDSTLLDCTATDGRFFASGGSTGKPKHVFYSNDDFDRLCTLLADNFRRAGLRPGMKAANLFAAGSLYSSFLAVDKYSEKIGLKQLPIGGLADPDDVVDILAHHKPEAIFGLPGLIIQFAQRSLERGVKLTIPMVFFAGENLSDGQQAFLREIWGTTTFRSAGYASVDAGLIGWQCAHAGHGVHHLAAPHVKLEVLDGEAVVTSFIRTAMPVVRYRTGDRVTMLEGPCPCGDSAPRFKLLGRMDGQINIWACRVLVSDLEKVLGSADFQAVVTEEGPEERLRVRLPPGSAIQSDFAARLWEINPDLRKTVSQGHVAARLVVVCEEFESNPRTGKTPRLVDKR